MYQVFLVIVIVLFAMFIQFLWTELWLWQGKLDTYKVVPWVRHCNAINIFSLCNHFGTFLQKWITDKSKNLCQNQNKILFNSAIICTLCQSPFCCAFDLFCCNNASWGIFFCQTSSSYLLNTMDGESGSQCFEINYEGSILISFIHTFVIKNTMNETTWISCLVQIPLLLA